MRAVVVGAGALGELHARAWASFPDVHLSAVVDRDEAAARNVARRWGGKAEYYLKQGLDGADVVSVCTPPNLHAEHVAAAAAVGADVLLEKPAATRPEDYDRMQAATDRGGIRLMVGMTGRFYPEMRLAKEWIEAGRVGKVDRLTERSELDASDLPDWYFDRRVAGGGVLMTNGIHTVDRFFWLTATREAHVARSETRKLYARGDVEDFALAHLFLDDEIRAELELRWRPGATGTWNLEVGGSAGTIRVTLYHGLTLTTHAGEREERSFYRAGASLLERTYVGVEAEAKALLDARSAGGPVPSPLAENRRAYEAIRDLYEKAGAPIAG